jgi:hypothetical protein
VPLLLSVIYYIGRFAQVIGMWLLVVDVFMAGPMGPSPRLFAAGVAVFLAGWGITLVKPKPKSG